MEPFRVECNVDEDDHVFFEVDASSIMLEPHVAENSGYICIDADQARKLSAWLEAAAKRLDALNGKPSQ